MVLIARSSKYEDAARTLHALGKHRLNDLLATTMPGTLLARVIPLISDKAFQGLADADIVPLMRSENEDVRKSASIKYVHAFPRRRVRQFLDEYMAADQFYPKSGSYKPTGSRSWICQGGRVRVILATT